MPYPKTTSNSYFSWWYMRKVAYNLISLSLKWPWILTCTRIFMKGHGQSHTGYFLKRPRTHFHNRISERLRTTSRDSPAATHGTHSLTQHTNTTRSITPSSSVAFSILHFDRSLCFYIYIFPSSVPFPWRSLAGVRRVRRVRRRRRDRCVWGWKGLVEGWLRAEEWSRWRSWWGRVRSCRWWCLRTNSHRSSASGWWCPPPGRRDGGMRTGRRGRGRGRRTSTRR